MIPGPLSVLNAQNDQVLVTCRHRVTAALTYGGSSPEQDNALRVQSSSIILGLSCGDKSASGFSVRHLAIGQERPVKTLAARTFGKCFVNRVSLRLRRIQL